jgi:hypothetical protein
MNKFENIYMVCPPLTETGGPEACHQLIGEMRKLNIQANLIYYKKKKTLVNLKGRLDQSIKGNVIVTPTHKAPTPIPYECYQAPFTNQIVDSEKSLLILPENQLHLINLGKNIKKGIWWLSVDNALLAIARLGSIPPLRSGVFHFYQSDYARQFLSLLSLENSFALSDYISERIFSFKDESISREKFVVYNPKKGFEFTQKIIQSNPDIQFVPLIGMTKDQVCRTLKRASLYIDFGDHPGKDRIPREAAILGCCVITSRNGSAKNSKDVSIPDEFKFDKKEENLKDIERAIKSCIGNYSSQTAKFDDYRSKIVNEKNIFIEEIRNAFVKNELE